MFGGTVKSTPVWRVSSRMNKVGFHQWKLFVIPATLNYAAVLSSFDIIFVININVFLWKSFQMAPGEGRS